MVKPDVFFVAETSIGHGALPSLDGYTIFSDKSIQVCNHGGLAFYIKNEYASNVFEVNFNTCFISFRLDFIPTMIFIGTYIQPESSKYFDDSMFGELSTLLMTSQKRNIIPILGGDLNCRYGNLNTVLEDDTLHYSDNTDGYRNSHGETYGKDVCNVTKIFPLNHLDIPGKSFEGNFTYFKGGGKSQIDFVYTSKAGLDTIQSFSIHKENWHLSDHLPIGVTLHACDVINITNLLKRSKDLNYSFDPNQTVIKRHSGKYNLERFERYLTVNKDKYCDKLLQDINSNKIEEASKLLEEFVGNAHSTAKEKTVKLDQQPYQITGKMEKANDEFSGYQRCLLGLSDDDLNTARERYQNARNDISKEMCTYEHNKWKTVVSDANPKKFWNQIDWKGSMSKQPTEKPLLEDLSTHFESLYSLNDHNELLKMQDLESHVYIPVLDDPITNDDITDARKSMKKAGYDFSLQVLDIVLRVLNPIVLILLNIMFYISYPANLAISLLTAIPKKGNLMLTKNYRGIQMLPTLGALYDRILANRLGKWAGVSNEQTAFQKGKSTTLQLFTIRLLIDLAYKTDTTLYMGFFDLEKAFDKVSRYILLKKLITLGIGSHMLRALKRLYSGTKCVLTSGGETSTPFQTYTGIRQGAPSSVFLFILFIDDLISFLKTKCIEEPLIGLLHCLLHADDTAVISTNRTLFSKKCDLMLQYMNENSLSLNNSKSSYLIINGKKTDYKTDLPFNGGLLEYKSKVVYLGALISDAGVIQKDLDSYISEKSPNITIKFNNFCRINFLAPVTVKLKVLDTCATAALLYCCETWANCSYTQLECLYRTGIKYALSIRNSVNNEIVYLESSRVPLTIQIKKRQLSFWNSIESNINENPDNPLKTIIEKAIEVNCKYLKYYKNLKNLYVTPNTCQKRLVDAFGGITQRKILDKATADSDSKLGAYYKVNPDLQNMSYETLFEPDRVITSRYRTGSHNLMVERGRISNPIIPREERLCICNTEIQTLEHCLLRCPLLQELYTEYDKFPSVHLAFVHPNIAKFLLQMEGILNIK